MTQISTAPLSSCFVETEQPAKKNVTDQYEYEV